MAKMRIHELAKELNVQTKDVLGFLEKKGMGEKYPTSSNALEEEDSKMVTAHFKGGSTKAVRSDGAVKTKKPEKQATAAAKQSKPDIKQVGSDAKQIRPDVKQAGADANTSRPDAKQAGSDANTSRPDAKQTGAEAKPAGTSARPDKAPGQAAKLRKTADAQRSAGAEGRDGDATERPKKRSNVTAVYNPQNSSDGNTKQRSRVYNAQDGSRRRRAPGEKPERRHPRPQNGQRRQAPVKSDAQAAAERSARYRREAEKKEAAQRKAREEKARQEALAAKEAEEQAAQAQTEAAAVAAQAATQDTAAKTTAQTAAAAQTGAVRRKPAAEGRDGQTRQAERGGSRTREDGSRSDRSRRSSRDDRTERRQGGERNGSYEKTEKGGRTDRSVQKGGQGNRNDGDHRSGNRNTGKGRPGYQKEQKPGDTRGSKRVEGGSAPDANKDNRGRNDRNKPKKKADYNKKNNAKNQERYVNLEKKTGFKKKNAAPQTAEEKAAKEEIRSIKVPEYITIRDLADLMKINASEIIKTLFLQGTILTVNQEVDYEKAEEIALQFNCIAEPEEKVDVIAELLAEEEESEDDMVARPPVVCVMGHVDHGKTSLLDCIRKTHVTDREAGGITQHIGASVAKINDRKITFLDTPGHEAFTAMRMRGANSTDIAILVVAADDGIMPQTIEAINHAKAAGIEIIVAINKIDKPNANIEKVKQGLAERELVPEDWGGSTICVPVSAKTGEGIDELLEMVLLTADLLELKANPKRLARGLVIEAKLDKGRGAVATVLVQKGTLKAGDPVAAGDCYGKVRAMSDHSGKRVREAGPSMPVEIFGLNSVPGAGEVLMSFDNEKEAKNFANTFVSMDKERLLEETRARRNLDDIFSQIQAGDLQELDLIVKADVQGSAEAVRQSLEKISNEEVVVKVIHAAVGNVTESDVNLATASNAIIIGFNVKVDNVAKSIADHENVDIRLYSVSYQAIDDVENAMKGMLAPIYEERVIGHVEVRQLFKASGVGTIAGSYVLDGVVERGCKVRIRRGEEQIYEGDLASLKRFKDDVKEVKTGYECGLVISGFNDIAVDDIVEAYKIVEVPRT